jgi:holo-[acyl-carrier protein] synthase
MIFGIGADIVEVERVEKIYARHGHHFVKNILTPRELALLDGKTGKAEFIAGRWAAKEAFSKALGTGMCIECAFVEIEILPDDRNAPRIALLGETAKTAERLGISAVHVSISHERHYAVANVVLEKDAQ